MTGDSMKSPAMKSPAMPTPKLRKPKGARHDYFQPNAQIRSRGSPPQPNPHDVRYRVTGRSVKYVGDRDGFGRLAQRPLQRDCGRAAVAFGSVHSRCAGYTILDPATG